MNATTFVLVHPAWHGAWFWKNLAPLLRNDGHLVCTPTLTGLGERSHLARPDVGLDVHVTDVVTVLKHEKLGDVVIVGDSSSGAVVTGVADRAPDQIALAFSNFSISGGELRHARGIDRGTPAPRQ